MRSKWKSPTQRFQKLLPRNVEDTNGYCGLIGISQILQGIKVHEPVNGAAGGPEKGL